MVVLMYRVIGLFPFGSGNDGKLKENIANGRFAENDRFKQLTVNCRNLIHHLLEVNPSNRYSAEEALNHEWFTSEENVTDTIQNHRQTINNRFTKDLKCCLAEEALNHEWFRSDEGMDAYDSFSEISIPFDRSILVSSRRMNG